MSSEESCITQEVIAHVTEIVRKPFDNAFLSSLGGKIGYLGSAERLLTRVPQRSDE